MQQCISILQSIPLIRDLTDCRTFQAQARITLSEPELFVEAKAWCSLMWQEQRHQFRIVEGSRRTGPGTFEFADEHHAVEFALRFC